jgi:hypothetical protein
MVQNRVQCSRRHTVMSRCCGRVARLGDADICVFALFGISSGFLMYLECYKLSPNMHGRVGVSVPLGGVMCLQLWFVTLCLWLYCSFTLCPTETICLPYFTDCPIDFENGLVTLVHHRHVYIYIYWFPLVIEKEECMQCPVLVLVIL